MKPVIGMDTFVRENDEGKHNYFITGYYAEAVIRAGGTPVMLPACSDDEVIQSHLDLIDGLILIGGNDVSPELYGDEKQLPITKPSPELRQKFNQSLAKGALERDLPVLGICMGCQALNVAAGGTLFQDIPSQVKGCDIRHSYKLLSCPFHNVRIEKGSLLYRIVEKEVLEVNTSHHQAVRDPGKGFMVTARSEDGIIECIENPEKNFALGVQWHPEIIHERPDHLALFRALVQASS